MVKFRQNFDKRKQRSNVDGFISTAPSNLSQNDDIRKRFRQNYRPEQNTADLHSMKRLPEEFYQKNTSSSIDGTHISERAVEQDITAESSHVGQFDLNLGDVEEKKKFAWLRSRKEKKKGKFKRTKRAVGAFSLIAVLGLGSILGYAYLKQRQIFRGNGNGAAALEENVDPSRLNGEGDGRINILLLGKGGPTHEAPDLTDTILLASIDPVHNEAAILSVPRDLYVTGQSGQSSKINAVYSNAKMTKLSQLEGTSDTDRQTAEDVGLQAIKEMVSEVLGVPVHYYVMIDFTAFKKSIDSVGGITIDVKEPLYDATMAWLNGGSALIADEGLQSFDGDRALMYARSRYGSARGDFDRTGRQREVIMALQQKILSVGTFANPLKVIDLISALGDNVRTDLNGTGELKRLYEIAQLIGPDKFASVSLADPPNILVTTSSIAGQSVVVPIAGVNQYEDIQSYVRNTLRDAFLKQENARVMILNGTATPGLATLTEKELESYGYNIVGVDNAPTEDYVETQLIDLNPTMNQYTASYLEKRIGVQKTTNVIEGLPTVETADFVIILGSNEEATQTTTN